MKNRDIVDYSKKRFYDFEPVELLTKILLHHDKGEFRWPAVRLSPPSSSQEIGVQDGSIGVLGKRMRRKRSPEQVKVARQVGLNSFRTLRCKYLLLWMVD